MNASNRISKYFTTHLSLIIVSLILVLSAIIFANDKNTCVLSNEEVSGVINQEVIESFEQGNWGIASTCTYSTKASPVAVMISSVASTDLSTDRMYKGYKELEKLGDEAIWVSAVSTLSVVNKEKNKLIRIKIDLPNKDEDKLAFAAKLAELALKKL